MNRLPFATGPLLLHVEATRAPLPEDDAVAEDTPELAFWAQHYLRARRQRDALFKGATFADPGWDILLDLFASAGIGRRVYVTDACIASAVPATTGLRYLAQLERDGHIRRIPDPSDRRRAQIELTAQAHHAMELWLWTAFVEP